MCLALSLTFNLCVYWWTILSQSALCLVRYETLRTTRLCCWWRVQVTKIMARIHGTCHESCNKKASWGLWYAVRWPAFFIFFLTRNPHLHLIPSKISKIVVPEPILGWTAEQRSCVAVQHLWGPGHWQVDRPGACTCDWPWRFLRVGTGWNGLEHVRMVSRQHALRHCRHDNHDILFDSFFMISTGLLTIGKRGNMFCSKSASDSPRLASQPVEFCRAF